MTVEAHLESGAYLLASDDERATLRAHADACPDCARLVEEEAELTTLLALAEPPVYATNTWARLEQSTASDLMRFVARCSEVFDLSLAKAAALLRQIADPSAWIPAHEGIDILHVEGGPRVANALTGIVRFQPGAPFPEHKHLGPEIVVVMQGEMRVGDKSFFAGDELPMEPGTVHQPIGGPEGALILSVSMDGFSLGDELIGPDDPRA
ncbi:MAG: cupin domain-containing protein [Deltaproteobacteria bacterium]|nr:cupin domain-containing protein [Deltaproteobacteria bacterium]